MPLTVLPPTFEPLEVTHWSGRRRHSGGGDGGAGADVEGRLARSGCGPWQAFYAVLCGMAWSLTASVSYGDKFIGAPHSEKQQFIAFDTTETYTDYYDDLKLLEAVKEDVHKSMIKDKTIKESVTLDDFVNDQANQMMIEEAGRSIAKTAFKTKMFQGWAIGVLLVSFTDKISTKWVAYCALVFFLVCWLAQPMAAVIGLSGVAAFQWMCWFRFFAFVGQGCFSLSMYCWMDEMFSRDNKAILNILPNVCWVLGGLTAGALHQWVLDWKTYYYILAAAGASLILALPQIIESPLGLLNRRSLPEVLGISKSKVSAGPERMLEGINYIREANGLPPLDDLDEDDNSEAVETNSKEPDTPQPAAESNDGLGRFAVNLAIMVPAWLAWAIGFWGISNENTSGTDMYTDNFGAQVMGLPGYVLAGAVMILIDDMRLLMSVFYALSFLCLALPAYAFHKGNNGIAAYLNFAATIFFSGVSAMAYVVTPTIFEGRFRLLGTGVCCVFARVGGIVTAWISSPECLLIPTVAELLFGEDEYSKALLAYKAGDKEDMNKMWKVVKPLLFSLPALLSAVVVWFLILPAGSGSTAPKASVSARLKEMIAGMSSSCSVASLFSWTKGDWSYFLRRPMLLVAAAIPLAIFLSGSIWATMDLLTADPGNSTADSAPNSTVGSF